MRTSKDYLFTSTSLNIFVVTNMCNMKCIYCQAQHQNTIKKGNMTEDTAYRAIDIALQSPSPYLTFEFQGGEPLINYPVIKKMIEYAEKNKLNKIIDYTLVSNLSLITDEMIEFLKQFDNLNLVLVNHGQSDVKETFAKRILNEIKTKYVGILGSGYLFRVSNYGLIKTMGTKFE